MSNRQGKRSDRRRLFHGRSAWPSAGGGAGAERTRGAGSGYGALAAAPERLIQDFVSRGLVVLGPDDLGIPTTVHDTIYEKEKAAVRAKRRVTATTIPEILEVVNAPGVVAACDRLVGPNWAIVPFTHNTPFASGAYDQHWHKDDNGPYNMRRHRHHHAVQVEMLYYPQAVAHDMPARPLSFPIRSTGPSTTRRTTTTSPVPTTSTSATSWTACNASPRVVPTAPTRQADVVDAAHAARRSHARGDREHAVAFGGAFRGRAARWPAAWCCIPTTCSTGATTGATTGAPGSPVRASCGASGCIARPTRTPTHRILANSIGVAWASIPSPASTTPPRRTTRPSVWRHHYHWMHNGRLPAAAAGDVTPLKAQLKASGEHNEPAAPRRRLQACRQRGPRPRARGPCRGTPR